MIYQIDGDLLENVSNGFLDYAVHQVNCKGRMGSGIAKDIKAKWPQVYTMYAQKVKSVKNLEDNLGTIQIVCINNNKARVNDTRAHNQYVVNFFSQCDYGRSLIKYTYYDAFWNCLNSLARSIPLKSKIGFPYKIGCGLGGGNWPVIQTMIQEVLGQSYEVYIYNLGGK